MKTRRLLFIALILTIPVFWFALRVCWNPWKLGDELTRQESLTLTNAVRNLTTNPIISIVFSDTDNQAFVRIRYKIENPAQNQGPVYQDGFILQHTYDHGSVYKDGFVFERTKSGWNYLPIPSNELERK